MDISTVAEIDPKIIFINPLVEIGIGPANRAHYESLGYRRGTRRGERIIVYVTDLQPSCSVRVDVFCPLCKEKRSIHYRSVLQVGHTYCRGCARTRCVEGVRIGYLIGRRYVSTDKKGVVCWKWECVYNGANCKGMTIATLGNVLGGHTSSCGCLHSEIMSDRIGDKHPMWKSELTDEERYKNRSGASIGKNGWRNRVLARDNHTCRVCESCDNLTVHHLFSYKGHPQHRHKISNGITLCHDCHYGFHSWMGSSYVPCTKDDFNNWLVSQGIEIMTEHKWRQKYNLEFFQTGDAAYFIEVNPRTIQRWADSGHIKSIRDGQSKWRLIPIDEINRMRIKKGRRPLTDKEIRDAFYDRHPNIKRQDDPL